jgi:hypothetical protein
MSDIILTYPFDPTGTAASNVRTDEQHIIAPPDVTPDFYFIVPKCGPFFERDLKLVHYPSGRELVHGVDYHLGWKFISATRATAKPVFGSICILDRTLAGTIAIERIRYLGGDWQIDEARALEMLLSNLTNPRTTSWEQVQELPYGFPVIDHEWDLDDMVGATEVVESINNLAESIGGNSGGQTPDTHINNLNNPHQVTKEQVGLGNVPNFSVALLSDLDGAGAQDKFMTPSLTRSLIAQLSEGGADEHIADLNNPHETTKTQVGLGNVLNYGVASTSDMSGTTLPSDKYMTPASLAVYFAQGSGLSLVQHVSATNNPHGVTKTQIGLGNLQNYEVAGIDDFNSASVTHYATAAGVVAFVNSRLTDTSSHINNTSNPHQVTKAQVGLGSVENFGLATKEAAEEGVSNNVYMTPLRVKESVTVHAVTPLNTHIARTDNPHQVTKTQVGLSSVENYAIASKEAAETGSSNILYMTPLRVKEAIAVQAIAPLNTHIARLDNPHATTKAQVGLGSVENYAIATKLVAETGEDNTSYMTPLRTREAMVSYVGSSLSSHVDDVSNPHQVTKAQIGLGDVENYRVATASDVASNSGTTYLTPSVLLQWFNPIQTSITDHTTNTNNPHSVTKAQVGLSDVVNLRLATVEDYDTNTEAYVGVQLLKSKLQNPFNDARDASYVRPITRRFTATDADLVNITHNMNTEDYSVVLKDAIDNNPIFAMIDTTNSNQITITLTEPRTLVAYVTFYVPY